MYAYVKGDPVNAVDPTGLCGEGDARYQEARRGNTGPFPVTNANCEGYGPTIPVFGERPDKNGSGGDHNNIYDFMNGLSYASGINTDAGMVAWAPEGAFKFLDNEANQSKPKDETKARPTQRPVSIACGTYGHQSNQCLDAKRDFRLQWDAWNRAHPPIQATGRGTANDSPVTWRSGIHAGGCAVGIAGTVLSEGAAFYIGGAFTLWGCYELFE